VLFDLFDLAFEFCVRELKFAMSFESHGVEDLLHLKLETRRELAHCN